MRIPLAAPWFDTAEFDAVRSVLESGWVVQGPNVAEFERRLAELHGTRHAVAVTSATAGLHLVAMALGVGPGQSVLIPSFAWPSAANVCSLLGARPELVDVDARTYNLTPESLRAGLARATHPTVVMAVHEFGLPAPMDELRSVAAEYGCVMVEDAACAVGATVDGHPIGGGSACAVLSFHPRKSVTTGEGGAVVTDDDDLADQLRMLRNHGQSTTRRHAFPIAGLNYRMTDLQGALGVAQLDKLATILARRRELARLYERHLADHPLLRTPAWSDDHSWQTYMVVLAGDWRTEVVAALGDAGIGSGAGSVAAHCLDHFRETHGYGADDLPVARELHERGLALPLHQRMSDDDVDAVVKALDAAVHAAARSDD